MLIVAGDLTAADRPHQIIEFGLWVARQKYKQKIVIAGNHDNMVQTTPEIFQGLPDFAFTYLCDSGTEFEGLKIWGSPWSLWFHGINPRCTAFTGDENGLAEKYDLIPKDIDILVTHGPAFGIQDQIDTPQKFVGSITLVQKIIEIKPRLHVFGHIHEGYGKVICNGVIHVNASIVNEHYEHVNKPTRIEL